MRKAFFLLVALAFASVSQAVMLYWNSPDAAWMDSVKSGSLLYSATGTVSDTTLPGIISVAKGETGGITSDFKSVVDTTEESLWTPSEVNDSLYVATTGKENTGTYVLVLFDESKGSYAYAVIDAATATNAWLDSVGGAEGNPSFSPIDNLTFSGTLVPEPTVLALLALGVAGLALRRKA
ncbi:MAG: PEP-CTERM sorting domain-containing protein [Candidatus Spyradenecus sp.]